MSALITSVEHALAVAASDVVKTSKFVETSVLPVLKSAQANQSTIESITPSSPPGCQYRTSGFAVLGVVIKAIDDAGTAVGANGLNINFDTQLITDIKSIAAAVKGAVGATAVTA